MVKKKVRAAQDWVEDRLRRLCGRITPDKRVAVIITMTLLFACGSIYMVVSSIYSFGKDEGSKIHIEHIEGLQLEIRQRDAEIDSLNLLNNFHYEREEGEGFE